jgi:hypothetical protein
MFTNFKSVVVKAAAILSLAFALNVNAAVIKTDIVFIVDESGSMGSVQTNLRNNIGLFASILSAGNVEAKYALVGYGSGSDNIRQLTDFVDAATFATFAANLVASGGSEPAFDAIAFALNSLAAEPSSFSYRADAISNLIILTDEPDNGGLTSFTEADAFLSANNALFNAVLSGSDTLSSIGGLATNNGGSVFDLNLFGSNDAQVVNDFVTNFASVKLQETLTFCQQNPNDPACTTSTLVPLPPLAALFGMAIAGVLFRRKA